MSTGTNGLEVLTRDECIELLRGASLGRVALRIGESPTILPVNYALLGDDVVFRTDPGSKLSAALMRILVAFEVDDVDALTHTGWSVVVTGYADEIRDDTTLTRVEALDLEPWVTGGRDFVVRIATRTISGRRLAAT